MRHVIRTDAELRARGYSVPIYRAIQAFGGARAVAARYGRSLPTVRVWITEPNRIPAEVVDEFVGLAGADRAEIERDAAIAKARRMEARAATLKARAAEIRVAVAA